MSDAPTGRTPYLTVVSPGGDQERADVSTFPFLIGRQAGNQLVLRDNRISRVHARLIQRGAQVLVEDCGSTHGLFVNGERITAEHTLAAGDKIAFGSTEEAGYGLIFGWRDGALPGLVDRMPGDEHLAKLRSLVEVARALHASLQPEEVLGAVIDAALKLTGGERGYLLLKRDGDLQVTLARAAGGAPLASFSTVPLEKIRALLASRTLPIATVMEGGLCVPLLRVRTEVSPETVAISLNDKVGALYLEAAEKGALASGNRELLETLAVEAASVLENAALLEQDQQRRRMEQELEIARGIQRSLLPRKLPADGWLLASGSSDPTNEVGGDFYDLIHVRDDLWSIAMADVSGKGASSALLASLLQGAFLMAPENEAGIVAMLEHLNRYLYERTAGEKYATVFYAALEHDGSLHWANAGHCTPYLLNAAGLQTLDTNAMPVGLLDPAPFEVAKTQLAPGDKLVIFSDGLADAVNAAKETFDRPLRRLLRHPQANQTAAQLHKRILNELNAFTGGAPQRDDITLLVVEYKP
jgi:phosphoserine phosphatase RsbU/P